MGRIARFSGAWAVAGFWLILAGCGSTGTPGSGGGGGNNNTPPPAPTVTALSPASATAGSAGLTLTVTGANFVQGSEITWQGTEQPTLYVSSTSLQMNVLAGDLEDAATVQVGVDNPASEGGASRSTLPFLISSDISPNPVPVLTSISPNSAMAGAGSTQVTLTGSNFIPASQVLLNGSIQLSTVYESSTLLMATIPSSSLATAGSLTLSVSNPTPGGGTSTGAAFKVNSNSSTSGETVVDVAANDLAWDPVNQVIYLSLPSSDGANGNSVEVLDPTTGNLGTSVFAGSEPDLLAVSKTSQYLYVSLDGSSSLQRFKLPGLTPDIDLSFGPANFFGSYVAMDVEASPAADGTVAFVLGNLGVSPEEEGGVLIYDDSTERANSLCGFNGGFGSAGTSCSSSNGNLFDSIQWSPAADEMYLLNNEDTGFDFYEAPVTASGFGSVTDYGALAGGFGDQLHYDDTTNMLYTDYGVVIDPATGEKAGTIDASGLAVPDGANGIIFYLGQTLTGGSANTYTIESFDIHHLTPIATLDVHNVTGLPTHFIRWGSNGLAFTTEPGGVNGGGGQVYIVSGSFVTNTTPGELPTENVRMTWDPRLPGRSAAVRRGTAH